MRLGIRLDIRIRKDCGSTLLEVQQLVGLETLATSFGITVAVFNVLIGETLENGRLLADFPEPWYQRA